MRSDNFGFAPVIVGGGLPDLPVWRRMRHLVRGFTEGEAIDQPGKMRQPTAIEIAFITRSYAASERRKKQAIDARRSSIKLDSPG